MRTIGYKDLPNSSLKSVGGVPVNRMFPLEAYLTGKPRAYIHYDGSVVRFFRLKSMEISKISRLIKSLPPRSSMQLYKRHTLEKDSFYVSLRKEIDYKDVLHTAIFRGFPFNPVRKMLCAMQDLTWNAYQSLSRAAEDPVFEEMDFLASDLPEVLLDCRIDELQLRISSEVRTNLSIIKNGESRFATIASLNNMAVIPYARGCLDELEYLERVLVVVPSEERRRKIQVMVLENGQMIQALSGETGKSRKVHVDTITGDVRQAMGCAGKVYYADVAFMLCSDTSRDLCVKLQQFSACLEKRNIALYCHTNTARATYISMFPGNEPYAERYSILYEYFQNMLIMNALEL